MEASARKVQAERNRNRLPHRGRASRWARRIAGLLATAAFLGAGVAMALMILPDTGNDESAIAAAPTTTPVKEKAKKKKVVKKKATKPKGPTKAQLAMRTAAVAELRNQGFTTLKLSDYDPKATLRVLVGRPVGDAAGGNRAFFFVKDSYLGNDSSSPSAKLTVVKTGKNTVTLSYGVYAPGDTFGAPSGRKRVRFRLTGGQLVPLDTIPADSVRFQRRKN